MLKHEGYKNEQQESSNLMRELSVAEVLERENLLEVEHARGGREAEHVERERHLERHQAGAGRGRLRVGAEVALRGGRNTHHERRVARGRLQQPARAVAGVGRVARAGAVLGGGGARALCRRRAERGGARSRALLVSDEGDRCARLCLRAGHRAVGHDDCRGRVRARLRSRRCCELLHCGRQLAAIGNGSRYE